MSDKHLALFLLMNQWVKVKQGGKNVKIAYGIDKKTDDIYADFDVVSPGDDLNEVDAVVVTSVTFLMRLKEC